MEKFMVIAAPITFFLIGIYVVFLTISTFPYAGDAKLFIGILGSLTTVLSFGLAVEMIRHDFF